MRISIIGAGYVGLVTGTCFAETGNQVICMDVDSKKISRLKKGKSPIYEPGLDSLLEKNLNAKRLTFTTSIKEAVTDSEVIFLCLPTPPGADGGADLRYVINVAEEIGKIMSGHPGGDAGETKHKLVVTKSTVPVGTGDKIKEIFKKYPNAKLDVASNPEFLKEGNAIQDFMSPDRVVIGTHNDSVANIMRVLYAPFMRTSERLMVMDQRSAELTKYAANTLLATKISFINEIADLCEVVGADVEMVRRGLASDPRIGSQFLFPGIGYGGSCFPKDVRALRKTGEEAGIPLPILEAVEAVNARQKQILLKKILEYFGKSLRGKIVAVWGLSFKPRTDDLREAPSVVIIDGLLKAGAKVYAHDPVANANAKIIFGKKVSLFKNSYDALKQVNALVVATEWNEFRQPDFEKMKSLMREAVIFDGRNVYDPATVREKGFVYFGIGRK